MSIPTFIKKSPLRVILYSAVVIVNFFYSRIFQSKNVPLKETKIFFECDIIQTTIQNEGVKILIDKKLINKIDAHIKENYIDFSKLRFSINEESYRAHRKKIDDMLEKFNFSFASYLRDFIKQKNLGRVCKHRK